MIKVTILILIDGFLQYLWLKESVSSEKDVTILILIDGFLQYKRLPAAPTPVSSHNPYFNRWFSAIWQKLNFLNITGKSQSLF